MLCGIYTETNIEDWDFRGCYIGSPNFDPEADLFLTEHYTTVVAVETLRLSFIAMLVDANWATLDEDGQHVRLVRHGDGLLRGMKSAHSRLTSEGRIYRQVVEALRRENKKYGRLRTTLLPRAAEAGADTELTEVASDEALTAPDRAFYDYVNAVGGYEPLVELVQQHGQAAGVELSNEEALLMIDGWRQWGIIRSMSIGEYLDEAWNGLDEAE